MFGQKVLGVLSINIDAEVEGWRTVTERDFESTTRTYK
jgi:hypothetical protein